MASTNSKQEEERDDQHSNHDAATRGTNTSSIILGDEDASSSCVRESSDDNAPGDHEDIHAAETSISDDSIKKEQHHESTTIGNEETIDATQTVTDTETIGIPIGTPGVDPAETFEPNQRPRRSTAGRWQSTRLRDEQADLHAQVFAQIPFEHKSRLKCVITPHNNKSIDHIALSQYHMNKGLKLFGKPGHEAIIKEMKQLHNLKVMEPRNLSNNDKKAAADYLMFLKEKRDKTIKARGCFDGRKQRATISKEESSSPTVATESVFITSAIEAHEGRDVAVVDLPGAFMQANQEDLVHMKLKGTLAKVLIMLDPQCYRKYIVQENGVSTLYVELQKALYAQLKAALLF